MPIALRKKRAQLIDELKVLEGRLSHAEGMLATMANYIKRTEERMSKDKRGLAHAKPGFVAAKSECETFRTKIIDLKRQLSEMKQMKR